MKKYSYDFSKYNFVKEIEKLYGVNDLSEIHNQWSDAVQYGVLNDVKTDQMTVYHEKFYTEVSNTNFYDIYLSFIKDFIKPIIEEDFLYQKVPTFRVHQPFNLAVAEFHSDADYSHSEYERNFYLPMTKAWGNNTIWVESKKDKKDFKPMVADVGDVWLWNGSNLLHGNKLNDTNKSRVSVDFRILPLTKYEESSMTSFTNQVKMNIGNYWSELD